VGVHGTFRRQHPGIRKDDGRGADRRLYLGPGPADRLAACPELGYELSPTALLEDNGVVHVPTHSGTVWAVDRKEGKLLWRYKASNCMVNGILPVGNHQLIISTLDGKLTCVTVND
jgi:hypothetical protein